MDNEIEQFISAIERVFISFGAADFEGGIAMAKNQISWLHEGLKPIATRADFRIALEKCEPPSKLEMAKAMMVVENLPSIVRHLISQADDRASATLPPLPSGRPWSIPPEKRTEVLDFITGLIRNGAKTGPAIARAAQKYQVGSSTIERLWSRRAKYGSDGSGPKVTMNEALKYLGTGV